jgi:hypothetical protein
MSSRVSDILIEEGLTEEYIEAATFMVASLSSTFPLLPIDRNCQTTDTILSVMPDLHYRDEVIGTVINLGAACSGVEGSHNACLEELINWTKVVRHEGSSSSLVASVVTSWMLVAERPSLYSSPSFIDVANNRALLRKHYTHARANLRQVYSSGQCKWMDGEFL